MPLEYEYRTVSVKQSYEDRTYDNRNGAIKSGMVNWLGDRLKYLKATKKKTGLVP